MKKRNPKNTNKRKLTPNKTQPKRDPKRRRLFMAITLFIPVLFFFTLEISLRIANYGINSDLFIPAQGDYSDYFKVNPQVGRRFFTNQANVPTPPNDHFLIKKPENGFRIFVMGGSTTAGYPYGNNLMFSRILNQRLSDTFPEKNIEIVNTATAAINSYALLDFADEILNNSPDAIFIYAGHNEFYGAFGVASTETLGKFRPIIKSFLKLNRFKTFLLIRDVIRQLKKGLANFMSHGEGVKPSSTLMERLVAEQNIPFHSPIYEAGVKQFRENLRDILNKTENANVPVLIGELVSNVRDQQPFISGQTDEFPAAKYIYQKAKKLESQKKFNEAKENYYFAKDLDALRFRATEEFNEVIHEVASEFNATVVPMKSYFESTPFRGIPGNGLFIEHLHPNIDGYFLMANAFFQSMRKNKMISSKWLDYKISPASYYRNAWGFTPLDSLYGDLRIKILKGGWPFKPKSAPNRAILNYIPVTKPESLAVKVWDELNFSLERGHVELAQYYQKQKNYKLAYEEYRALICLTPLNVSPYLKAADMLIKGGNFRSAFSLLKKSQSLEETFYANKWIGQILLNYNEVKQSLPYLEKAYKQDPADPQILYMLSGAYALNAQYKSAKEILNKLYKIAPDFRDPMNLRQQLSRITKQ